jgi:hypothetical protein
MTGGSPLQPRLIVAATLGGVCGFVLGLAVAPAAGSVTALVAGAVGFVLGGLVNDLAKNVVGGSLARAWRYARGDLRGHRRVERRLLGKAPVLVHTGARSFTPAWVDPWELDHQGWSYGVASSPTYVPLYGTGLAELDVSIALADGPVARADDNGERLLLERMEVLERRAVADGRPFSDTPLATLRGFTPPVESTALRLVCQAVGHRRYAASMSLLLEDDGALRARYGIGTRDFGNPMVCGALGAEVALVTSDGFLVLAHRGRLGTDYNDLVIAGIGRGISPELDRGPDGLDLRSTISRGALDEFGLRIEGSRAHILALGLEMQRMEPDLLGYVEIPHTRDEVLGASRSGAAKDRWETRKIEFIEFDPPSVAQFLRHRRDVTPATPMSLTYACLHRFGLDDTARAMAG